MIWFLPFMFIFVLGGLFYFTLFIFMSFFVLIVWHFGVGKVFLAFTEMACNSSIWVISFFILFMSVIHLEWLTLFPFVLGAGILFNLTFIFSMKMKKYLCLWAHCMLRQVLFLLDHSISMITFDSYHYPLGSCGLIQFVKFYNSILSFLGVSGGLSFGMIGTSRARLESTSSNSSKISSDGSSVGLESGEGEWDSDDTQVNETLDEIMAQLPSAENIFKNREMLKAEMKEGYLSAHRHSKRVIPQPEGQKDLVSSHLSTPSSVKETFSETSVSPELSPEVDYTEFPLWESISVFGFFFTFGVLAWIFLSECLRFVHSSGVVDLDPHNPFEW